MLRRRGNESQKLDSPGEVKRESEVVRDDKMVVVWGRQTTVTTSVSLLLVYYIDIPLTLWI
jgi:hypothetical protein